MNVIFKDDLKELSGKFNKQLSSDETTVIRHFLNIYKPWKFNYFKIGNNIKPLDNYDDFWKYAKIIPKLKSTEYYVIFQALTCLKSMDCVQTTK